MTERSRRRFMAYASGAIITAGVSSRAPGQEQATEKPVEQASPPEKKGNIRYGMVHDESKCIGCMMCVANCKKTNKVPEGVTRLQIIQTVNIPKTEKTKAITQFFRKSCQHCDNPPCVSVCPTGASYKDPTTGIVDVHENLCVGCRYCLGACPYQVRFIHPQTHSADKCNFCRDTNLAQNKDPACVSACPVKALTFGDLNDPESKISQVIKANATYRSKLNLGTEPKLYRIPGKRKEITDDL